jgi:hypothetical protein
MYNSRLCRKRCCQVGSAAEVERKKFCQLLKNCAKIEGFADRSELKRKEEILSSLILKNIQPISVGV